MTTSPPDGHNMMQGVWGTDMDRSTTVVRSGKYSVHAKSTAASDAVLISDKIPLDPNIPLRAYAVMQADNVTAKNVRFSIFYYDATETILTGTGDNILLTPLPSINTWYEIQAIVIPPSAAAFYAVVSGRITANFNCYIDIAEAQPMRRGFFAYLSANQTVPTNTTYRVAFDTESYDYGGLFTPGSSGSITAIADAGGGDIRVTSTAHGLSVGAPVTIGGTTNYDENYVINAVTANTFDVTATYVSSQTGYWSANARCTIPRDGVYAIAAKAPVGVLSDQKKLNIVIYKNGAIWLYSELFASGSNTITIDTMAPAVWLERGDYLDVFVWHNEGADRGIVGDGTVFYSYFSVMELQ